MDSFVAKFAFYHKLTNNNYNVMCFTNSLWKQLTHVNLTILMAQLKTMLLNVYSRDVI